MIIRGVAHIHSHYSYDGRESLPALKSLLMKDGIRFALMAEHVDELIPERAHAFLEECAALSDGNFLFIPGFEVPYLGTHVLALGVHDYSFSGSDVKSSLNRWRDQGAFIVLAHPHRNDFCTDNFMEGVIHGVEVWNSQYDGKRAPRPRARALLRRLRTGAAPPYAFASLDLHRTAHVGGPYLAVEATGSSEREIIDSLRSGNFTIQRGATVIGPNGALVAGNRVLLFATGSISIGIIWLMKKISTIARSFGIKSGGKLASSIRKII